MGINFLKKGVWIVLAFSVALNIGVIATVIAFKPPNHIPMQRLPGPENTGIQVLAGMDLSDDVKDKMAAALQHMNKRHFDFMQQVMKEEDKLIEVISQPGPLDKIAFERQKEVLSRMLGQTVSDKIEHLIEIRDLIGPEKTRYYFSEVRKRFQERTMMERSGKGAPPPPPPMMESPGMMKRPEMEIKPAN